MVILKRERQQLRLILFALCCYNPSQNILKIVVRSSVFMESLMVDFAGFSILNFYFGREIRHWAITAHNFEILKVTFASKLLS